MPNINNTNIYVPDTDLSAQDSWVGSNYPDGKVKTYYLRDIQQYIAEQLGIGESQNNTYREIAIGNIASADLITTINALASYTVGATEVVYFTGEFIGDLGNFNTKFIYALKTGKNTYGVGATQIALSDLLLINPVQEATRNNTEAVATILNQDKIISGRIVPRDGTLIFDSTEFRYVYNGIIYIIPPQELTLSDADATHGRFDRFVIDFITANIQVLEGTPSATPEIEEPLFGRQITINEVYIPANATEAQIEPGTDFEYDLISNETDSEPNEWDLTATGTNVEVNYTTDPLDGSKSLRIPTNATGLTIWTKATEVAHNDNSFLEFGLKLAAPLTNTSGGLETASKIIVSLVNSGQNLYRNLYLYNFANSPTKLNGKYDFDNTSTDWQTITIPLSDFQVAGNTLDTYDRFQLWAEDHPEFYVDRIRISTAVSIINNPTVDLPTKLSDLVDDIGATDPIFLDTYIIDLQNGDDSSGQFQNGANPYLTLQASLDDAVTQGFDENDTIRFVVQGTGTAYITKKHGNYNHVIECTGGANISYENYAPIASDLVVLEGHLATTDDRKAQGLSFEYITGGEVTFGNTAGDALDFGRGMDLTVNCKKFIGLSNFGFSRLQQFNVDTLETEWNHTEIFALGLAGLADTRYLKSIVNLGDITINTVTDFDLYVISGNHTELHWSSFSSTSITNSFNIYGVAPSSSIKKYSIGSVNTPNVTGASTVTNTSAELEVDINNVDTWSDNVYLNYWGNEGQVFTGNADFTASTTALARYYLHFRNCNELKLTSAVTTNLNGNSRTPLILEDVNITYTSSLVVRSGSTGAYTLPNYVIRGYCYIAKTGASASIFANLDPTIDYDQSIEINGKLVTYNCTYKDELYATIVDNNTEESGSVDSINTGTLTLNSTIMSSQNVLVADNQGMNESRATSDIVLTIQNETNQAYPDNFLAPYTRKDVGNITLAAESGVTFVNAQTYNLHDILYLWRLSANTWTVLNPPKNINGNTNITFKPVTDGYTIVASDGDENTYLYYEGATDITINVPLNATLGISDNIEIKTYSLGAGKIQFNYESGVTGTNVRTDKTSSTNHICSIMRNGSDNWIPKGAYEVYTPPTPTTIPVYVGTATREAQFNTVSFDNLSPTSGNRLFLMISAQAATDFTVPAGWTSVSEISGAYTEFHVYTKISDGTEGTDNTTNILTVSNTSGDTAQLILANVVEFSGVNASGYESLATSGEIAVGTSTVLPINSLTSTNNNSLAVSFIMNNRGRNTEGKTDPTDYTEVFSYGTSTGGDGWHLVYTQDMVTAGTIAADSIEFPNGENLVSVNLVLIPE